MLASPPSFICAGCGANRTVQPNAELAPADDNRSASSAHRDTDRATLCRHQGHISPPGRSRPSVRRTRSIAPTLSEDSHSKIPHRQMLFDIRPIGNGHEYRIRSVVARQPSPRGLRTPALRTPSKRAATGARAFRNDRQAAGPSPCRRVLLEVEAALSRSVQLPPGARKVRLHPLGSFRRNALPTGCSSWGSSVWDGS
jgi:hypothetical protein